MDFARLPVDDLRRLTDITAHGEHCAGLDDDAFGDFGAGTDETVVLDDHRVRLQRFENAADADTAREVTVLADLGARADRRPGVHHGAAVDISAEIDEARHQDDAGGDEGGMPDDRTRYRAEARLAETIGIPVHGFERHLVPIGRAGLSRHRFHIVQPERQQHGLFKPLIDVPTAIAFLGDAGVAAVHQVQRGLDGVAHFTLRVGCDRRRVVPRVVDGILYIAVTHWGAPSFGIEIRRRL